MDANTTSNIVIAVTAVLTLLGAASIPVIIGWANMRKDIAALRDLLEASSGVINSLRTEVEELKIAQAVTQTQVRAVKEDLGELKKDSDYIRKNMLKDWKAKP